MHSDIDIDLFINELSVASIERIAILFNQIKKILESTTKKESSERKVKHFENCLKQLFAAILECLSKFKDAINKPSKEEYVSNLIALFDGINKLRDELAILPKPDEPTELYRFLRIFNRKGIANKFPEETNLEHKEIFILYAGQERSASTYSETPLEPFEINELKPILDKVYRSSFENLPQSGEDLYHICIPREETTAPLYWPNLAHEIGHQVMEAGQFKGKNIESAFSSKFEIIKGTDSKLIPEFKYLVERINERYGGSGEKQEDEVLRNWLTECWCDIYGYFATGPAFIFSQLHTFILDANRMNDIGSTTHPPYYLRLLLIQEMSKMHQLDSVRDKSFIKDPLDSQLATWLINENPEISKATFEIAKWFFEFFKDHFNMEGEIVPNLKEHVAYVKSCSEIFTQNNLQFLVNRLKDGYPIPSEPLTVNSIYEKETSVHAIMLTAWIAYKSHLINDINGILDKYLENYGTNTVEQHWSLFKTKIYENFYGFYQAVLRSLQISEWVSLLKPNQDDLIRAVDKEKEEENKIIENEKVLEQKNHVIEADKKINFDTSLLVDWEIKENLKNGEIKIIPLINLEKQLGSTSLDVRLGPTFQTYQPNQSGVIDFTDKESMENVHLNSSIVDLDYKGSIVLAPGQFVLAHTMEYIGLSANVAAQIEGRSSFARLGIQVHMTASLIDPGFHGSVTFEIYNAGPNPIKLYPGYRVGQLRFFRCNKPQKPYNLKENAKYRGLLIYSGSLLAKDYEIKRICP